MTALDQCRRLAGPTATDLILGPAFFYARYPGGHYRSVAAKDDAVRSALDELASVTEDGREQPLIRSGDKTYRCTLYAEGERAILRETPTAKYRADT